MHSEPGGASEATTRLLYWNRTAHLQEHQKSGVMWMNFGSNAEANHGWSALGGGKGAAVGGDGSGAQSSGVAVARAGVQPSVLGTRTLMAIAFVAIAAGLIRETHMMYSDR
jgi:hypothetical protein